MNFINTVLPALCWASPLAAFMFLFFKDNFDELATKQKILDKEYKEAKEKNAYKSNSKIINKQAQ